MTGFRGNAFSLRSVWPALLVLLATGCAQLPPRPEAPLDAAVALGTGTRLDEAIAPAQERYPGQSGFRLVSQGPEAFAVRAHAAGLAGRSVDVQTYIWHGDQTGLALAYPIRCRRAPARSRRWATFSATAGD